MGSKKGWGVVVALAMAACMAFGQDSPTLKGDNARTGKTGDPLTYSPGRMLLNWYHPTTVDGAGSSIILDNDDAWQASKLYGVGTFALGSDNVLYRSVAASNQGFDPSGGANAGYWAPAGSLSLTSGWTAAPTSAFASGYYVYPLAPSTATPYRYVTTIPSAQGDPTAKLNAGDTLETATYTISPSDAAPRPYALYISIPTGATTGVFPQRYYVVKVSYGNGLGDVQIVDTRYGSRFVRLGNGGGGTNKLYQYDGVHPLVVTLYNTIPRDSSGDLLDANPYASLVYADAVMATPEVGGISATPSIFSLGGGDIRVVSALNQSSLGVVDGVTTTIQSAVVSSYDLSTGALRWKWSPSGASTGVILDNLASGVVVGGSFSPSTAASGYYGSNYEEAAITNVLGAADDVAYSPTLDDGQYDVYVYLPGDSNGEAFAHALQINVKEGAATTSIVVDASQNSGWLRLVDPAGDRKFTHNHAGGEDLSVEITNYSGDAADATRKAYADAVWFVGAKQAVVTSSPVQATVSMLLTPAGPTTSQNVCLVAGEDGKLYCLDATGNGDGTTNVLWTYPSTIPETVATWNGGTTYAVGDFAKGSDGVVYRSIQGGNTGNDPSGGGNAAWWELGDPNAVAGLDGPGTIAQMPTGFDLSSALIENVGGTDRLYIGSTNGRIYCIDMKGRGDMNVTAGLPGTTTRLWTYPDDYPSTAKTSSLGAFSGSVAFATTAAGPTIFAPTRQGRLIALDAAGDTVNKVTTTRWMYPAVASPTEGPMLGTPAVDFGNVYVGTASPDGVTAGQLLAINQDTGALTWNYNDGGAATDFLGGPATAGTALLDSVDPDTVYASNENGYVYALKASDGTVIWKTNELAASVRGPLEFARPVVYNTAGALVSKPVVIVPCADGRMASLFAESTDVNLLGGRLAHQYNTAGGLVAGVANGRNHVVAGDQSGYVYAFNDVGNGSGGDIGGPEGASPAAPPNNPSAANFSDTTIKFITRTEYEKLESQTPRDYTEATDVANADTATAYEWGQTIYVLVYNFPYDADGTGAPSFGQLLISQNGESAKPVAMTSYQFNTGSPTNGGGKLLDGMALYSITIKGYGDRESMAPGPTSLGVQMTYGGVAYPTTPSLASRSYNVANPLALVMQYDGAGNPITDQQIGYTTDLTKAETTVNGSPDVYADPSNNKSRLTSTAGFVSHGQSGVTQVGVVDRSLMVLVDGANYGLSNVFVQRQDLLWSGLSSDVLDPLPALYSGFEDLPGSFPNTSLDYPDVKREQVVVTKDPNGAAQNPVVQDVSLTPPIVPDMNNPTVRTLQSVPFAFRVNVPRFQPPSASMSWLDSSGSTVAASNYVGKMVVFVSSDSKPQFDYSGAKREAYRTFNLAVGVNKDESLRVTTPIVDLGSLSSGAGYTPSMPGSASSFFDPISSATMFQPFTVENTGNVNLDDVRIAKGTNQAGTVRAWGLFSASNDILSWLDSTVNLWSNIDSTTTPTQFAPVNPPIIQKARVGDLSPTRMATNPRSRPNPNLSNSGQLADPGKPASGDPIVAVTVPPGFPRGTYQQPVYVVNDVYTNNQLLDLDANNVALEAASNPALVLKFNVVESLLTNSWNSVGAPMIDQLVAPGTQPDFLWSNGTPSAMRDTYGNLVVAFASDRDAFVPSTNTPTTANLNSQFRLYVASLQGAAPGTAPADAGTSPLADLNAFTPGSASQWWKQEIGPFPNYGATPLDTLFNSQAGESVLPETVQFHSPAFPSWGAVNPLAPQGAAFGTVTMAFVGDAQKQTQTGRRSESRLFASTVQIASDGTVTASNPVSMNVDTTSRKATPAVVQVGSAGQSIVYYVVSGGGHINYATFNGAAFGSTGTLELPSGFEYVDSPSATARAYHGRASGIASEADLTFTGKLRGATNTEVFFVRAPLDANGLPTGELYLPTQTNEPLVYDTDRGFYRSLGIGWNPSLQVTLQTEAGDIRTGAYHVDRNSGVVTFNTTLGGMAILDPNTGTIRLTGLRPALGTALYLTYQPRCVRVSQGSGVSYAQSCVAYDDRLVGDDPNAIRLSYWANPDGSPAATTAPVRSGRTWFTYQRSASGPAKAARPYWTTMRLGIQLPSPVMTNPDGSIVNLTVSGLTSYYQIDPANGRIYVTDADEDATAVTISYTGVNPGNGQPIAYSNLTYPVELVFERDEAPVGIDNALNESGLWIFADPFDPSSYSERRPGLMWLFWTSTRYGAPNLFFETMAPNFTPRPTGG